MGTRRQPVTVYTLSTAILILFLCIPCAMAQDPQESPRQAILDALATGAHSRAAALAQDWIEQDPTESQARRYAGRAALALGDAFGATRHLRRAVALDPGSAEAWWWLGEAAAALDDQDAALAAYWRARRIDPEGPAAEKLAPYNPAWLAYNAAYTHYSRGQHGDCLVATEALLGMEGLGDDLGTSARLMRSECLLRLGRLSEGLELARRLLVGEPDLRPMGPSLAAMALESGLYGLAGDVLDASGSVQGPDGALISAWAAAANGRAREAAEAVARALGAAPPQAGLDDAVRWQGLLDGALLALAREPGADRALAAMPPGPSRDALIGCVRLLKGDADDGLDRLRTARGAEPSSPWLTERLAWGLRLTGSHEPALTVLEGYPGEATAMVRGERLDTLLYLGRVADAESLLRQWRGAAPEETSLLFRHAAVLAEMGRYSEALDLLRAEDAPETVSGAELDAWADYLESLTVPAEAAEDTPPFAGEPRVLSVRIAADEEFRWDPRWRQVIRALLADIEPVFAAAGIDLQISRAVEWDSRDRAWTLNELHSELRREIRRDRDDLVLGFTAQTYGGGEVTGSDVAMGEAALLQDYAIIRFDRLGDVSPAMRRLQVAHELAHIFGAHHVETDATLMRSRMSGRPVLALDPANVRILRLTRECDFDAGVASLSEEARAALLAHRWAEAEGSSDDATHYVDLAHMSLDLMDPQAVEWARRAVILEPEELAWRILFADLLAWDRQIDAARTEMLDLVPIAMESADIGQLRSLGRSLSMIGEPEEGAKLLRRTVDLARHDGWLLAEYSATLYAGGDHEMALEMLERALEVEPDDPFLRSEIAAAYIEVDQPDRALEQARAAVDMDPSNPGHWERLGHVRVERDEREQGLEAFRTAVDVDPEYAYAHNAVAWTLVEMGRFEEAEAPVLRCLALEPSYAPAIDTLGHVLNGLGRPEEGLEAFDRALELMPREPASWYGRGASLEALGRTEEAIDAYQRAAAEDLPGGEWIEKATDRLEALGAEVDV
ncbi:MAG: tetratricopeptide repeat protein [Armatimonadia bacterium]|nr:tetratricopeptide repeat protein [Armatimonadia bacterium]